MGMETRLGCVPEPRSPSLLFGWRRGLSGSILAGMFIVWMEQWCERSNTSAAHPHSVHSHNQNLWSACCVRGIETGLEDHRRRASHPHLSS